MRPRWFVHPLLIFILSLVALGASLFLYIHWYLQVDDAFRQFLKRYGQNTEQFFQVETWAIILILSLLMALIIVGMGMIYLFYQKMTELYRMQQNFINGLTHELKTPVTSLRLFIETFQKHQLSRQEQLKYLAHMDQDVSRLNDNIGRILNMARLEERKITAEKRMCDLGELIQNYLHANQHLFSHVGLTNKVPLGKFFFLMGPELFELLLANLVQNAISHNPNKEKTIELDCQQNKKFLNLYILDNGPGIENKERKKIFRKFYQVGRGTKGSGIGLFLVQQITKIYHGKIQALTPKNNQGTLMQVTFPITEV